MIEDGTCPSGCVCYPEEVGPWGCFANFVPAHIELKGFNETAQQREEFEERIKSTAEANLGSCSNVNGVYETETECVNADEVWTGNWGYNETDRCLCWAGTDEGEQLSCTQPASCGPCVWIGSKRGQV